MLGLGARDCDRVGTLEMDQVRPIVHQEGSFQLEHSFQIRLWVTSQKGPGVEVHASVAKGQQALEISCDPIRGAGCLLFCLQSSQGSSPFSLSMSTCHWLEPA